MKRNSTTLFLVSTGAVTPIPWVNDAPDFSAFTEPTLSVLQKAWQNFLISGEELEIIPDPEPPPPAPDWLSFNLTLIPPAPGSQTSFEMWLEQFKIQHQSPLVSAAGLGHLEETQRLYDSLKAISQDGSTPQAPPTAEQIAEWQGIADANHVPLRF